MPIPDNDIDPEALISRLAGPLSASDKEAFRRAAEDALTRVPCWGEGAVYRTVAVLQRQYFSPPPDNHDALPRHFARSKLRAEAAIGADDPRAVAARERAWARK